MKVLLNQIPEEGLPVEGELPAAFIGLTEKDYLHFISPVSVEGTLQRFDDIVLGNFIARGRFESFCYRSLEKVQRDWAEKFQIEFAVTKDTEFLELDEDLRQEILLLVPIRVLSDSEMKKDAAEAAEKKKEEKEKQKNKFNSAGPTYRPFENLKDLDNT